MLSSTMPGVWTIVLFVFAALPSDVYPQEAACLPYHHDGTGASSLYTADDVEHWLYDDLDWAELNEDQRLFLSNRRWTAKKWDCRADEESLYEWNEMTEERRQLWKTRGWDQERWDNEDPCAVPMIMSTPEAFIPLLVNISVAALDALTMDQLQNEKMEIRLVDGYAEGDSEDFSAKMQLSDIVTATKDGTTAFYLHLEEGMREKKDLQAEVGDKVIDSLLHAINNNEEIRESGLWNPMWNNLEKDDYDWALFLGPLGSRSPTHYDSDVFNFIYVVEGKKNFVVLPNDERTEGTFETWLNEDGGTGWGSVNLLDRPLPEHAVEIEISAGQGLVIPYACWHAVENLAPTLAYSIRVPD